MPAPSSGGIERIGLVALDVERRDGFVGVCSPSVTRAIGGDEAAQTAPLDAPPLRVTTPSSPTRIVGVLSDPFPAPRPDHENLRPRSIDDVLWQLERRQPRSHRVAPGWYADRRMVRALEDARRRFTTLAPVADAHLDDAPPTLDAAALEVATTERAIWPDEPSPLPAPEPRAFDTADAGRLHALGAWPAVLLDLLCAPGATSRDAVQIAAERFDAVGDARRALIAWAALGDDGARERLLASPRAPRLLRWPVAAFASDAGERDKGRLQRLASLEARGQRLEVAAALEAIAIAEGDARIAELAATVRASLALPRSLVLDVDGEEQRFVLADAVTLGRASADVIVPGSLVSRRHLGFGRVDGVPTVTDLASHNGTEIEGGGRLKGSRAITAELRLRLGGAVPCVIAPHRHGVALDVAGARRVLTLGSLGLGTFTLSASGGAVVCSGQGTFDGRPFSDPLELALGDALRDAAGVEVQVRASLDGPS